MPAAGDPRAGDAVEIDEMEVRARLGRLEELLAQEGLAGAVVFGRSFYDRPGAVAYLTGYLPPFPSSADAPGISGLGQVALCVVPGQRPLLLTDRFVRPQGGPLFDAEAHADVGLRLAEVLRRLGGGRVRIGVGGLDIVPYGLLARLQAALEEAQWVVIDAQLHAMRRRKSEADVRGLRAAAGVAAQAFEAAIAAIGEGARERDVAAAGMAAAMAAGADFVRYLRVHAGLASAGGSRWPPATDARIAKGDLVSMDFVGAAGGYGFDLERTVLVAPAPPAARELLLDAHRVEAAALAALHAGQTVEGLCEAIRRAAGATPSAPYLTGFYGHGIGLETLEWPYLLPGQSGPLIAGEVLCIEPGLRRPDLGGAEVEDEVLVTESGSELLSDFRRTPIIV